MDLLLKLGLYLVAPLILSMGAYIVRNVMTRLDTLEEKMDTKISEGTVRQIISDKLDPLRDDLSEIKDSINKLFDMYVNDQKRKD